MCSVRSTTKYVVSCAMVKNLESNHAMWVTIIDDETQQIDDANASDVNAAMSSVTQTILVYYRAVHCSGNLSVCLSVCL